VDSPFFSLIIPTRNEEKLLPSLLAQFPSEFREAHALEWIVSDAGSSDGTAALARGAGATVVVHSLPYPQTIAEGRNAGASIATGTVLVFLNADARIADPPLFFARLRARFAEDAVNAATFPVTIFPEEEKSSDRFFIGIQNTWFRLMNDIGIGMGRGECQAVRRTEFLAVNGYNPAFAAGEDFDLFRRLRRRGAVAWMGDCRVYESPRRYRKYGYLRVWGLWFANAMGVMFVRRAASRSWKEVR
jgi:glycosyltransferase involved in cell wall biosynthesis